MIQEVESQQIDRATFLTLLRDGGPWHGKASAVRTAVNVLQQSTDPSGEILIELNDVFNALQGDPKATLSVTVAWSILDDAEAAARKLLTDPKMKRALDAAGFIFFAVRGPQEGLLESANQVATIVYPSFPKCKCIVLSAREEAWLEDAYCVIFVAI